MAWQQHKHTVLEKADKSFKGSIDAPILDLVTRINASESCFTTSSCSGRIMLVHEKGEGTRKNNASFVFVSHEYIDSTSLEQMLSAIDDPKSGHLFLKLEPLIIHIECETLDNALWLLHRMKKESAFKHTSIVSAANSKYVVCVKGVVKLEIPIIYSGQRLCTVDIFKRYIDIGNARMTENFEAISKLTLLAQDGVFAQLHDNVGIVPIGFYEKSTCALMPVGDVLPDVVIPPAHILRDGILLLGEHIQISTCGKFVKSSSDSLIGIIPDCHCIPSSLGDATVIRAINESCVLTYTPEENSWWLLGACLKKNRKWGKKYFWRRISLSEDEKLEFIGVNPTTPNSMPDLYFKGLESIYATQWT